MRLIHDFIDRPSSTSGLLVRTASVCRYSRISRAIEPVGHANEISVAATPGFDQQRRSMPFPLPKPFFNALVRKGRHGEPGMGDAETAFFVGKHGCGGFDGIALRLGSGACPRTFKSMLQE